uniref:RNase NYN domain-containing protein n=1 Tax=Caenorhabditis japonica TaxID=281687 RepID=A0A8R1HWG6_CAEJA
MNSVDNYGWESSLSMVANEQTRTARHRHGVTLLRPVFMNAVEVGYSYAHCDRDKKLNVRGVTIALWHFICRGHQAIALLPYCFKNYAEKSSRYSELMMLYRLNLIEFTPGYGSEKYAEVNRIMVNRAYETGGCLVARSQMQGITDNKTNLIDVVEQRLLMPTFNGDDIMFPIDGPLGRNGPSLKQTLECEQGSSDWRSCSEHQLLLSDQRHWLEKLALLVPEKVAWTRMVQVIQAGGETSPSSGNLTGFDPLLGLDPPLPPSPPISTPNAVVDNPFQRSTTTNNVAIEQQHNSSYQQVNPSPPSTTPNVQFYDPNPYHPNNLQQPHYHLPNPHQLHRYRHQQMSPPPRRYYSNSHHHSQQHNGNGNGNGNGNSNSNNNNSNNNNNNNHNHYQHHHHRQHSTTRLILRYGPNGGQDARTSTSGGVYRRPTSRHSADSLDSASTQSGGSGVAASATTTTTTTGGAEIDENVARLLNAELVEEERREMEKRRKVEATQRKRDETLAKLSQIFGYSKVDDSVNSDRAEESSTPRPSRPRAFTGKDTRTLDSVKRKAPQSTTTITTTQSAKRSRPNPEESQISIKDIKEKLHENAMAVIKTPRVAFALPEYIKPEPLSADWATAMDEEKKDEEKTKAPKKLTLFEYKKRKANNESTPTTPSTSTRLGFIPSTEGSSGNVEVIVSRN